MRLIYAIILGFAFQAHALVYRFPIPPGVEKLERPLPGLNQIPHSLRILNPSMGNYFGAIAIEFEKVNGRFERSKTYRINYLQDTAQATDCRTLLDGQAMGQAFLDTLLFGTSQRRVGNQALLEMEARGYLSPTQTNAQMESAEGAHPDQFVFLETLSWLDAKEALRIFRGKIPWERVAEVDDQSGFTVAQLQERAALGLEGVRLRIRRATLRISLGILFDTKGYVSRARLPFEKELWDSGRSNLIPRKAGFPFEFGRASQIPGLRHEARELVAMGALVAGSYAHEAGVEDLRTATDPIFFHSFKASNTRLYSEDYGAKPLPGLDDPQDSALGLSLSTLLARTEAFSSMRGNELQNAIELQNSAFYLMELKNVEQVNYGQILVLPSPEQTRTAIAHRLSTGRPTDSTREIARRIVETPRQNLIGPESTRLDNSLSAIPFDWAKDADFALSGFNSIAARDPLFLKRLLISMTASLRLNFFKENPRLLVVSKFREGEAAARALGLNVFEFTGTDHFVRMGFVIDWKTIVALRDADPEFAKATLEQFSLQHSPETRAYRLLDLVGLL